MRWFNDITNSMVMSLHKFWEIVKDNEVYHTAVHGVTRLRHDLMIDRQNILSQKVYVFYQILFYTYYMIM